MSVDLTLLPLLGDNFYVAHDQLHLEGRRELWPEIEKLRRRDLPMPLTCYLAQNPQTGDPFYGERTEDPYGDPLRYVTVADLRSVADHPGITDNWRNRAIWAYLAQLPLDWKIVLYWH